MENGLTPIVYWQASSMPLRIFIISFVFLVLILLIWPFVRGGGAWLSKKIVIVLILLIETLLTILNRLSGGRIGKSLLRRWETFVGHLLRRIDGPPGKMGHSFKVNRPKSFKKLAIIIFLLAGVLAFTSYKNPESIIPEGWASLEEWMITDVFNEPSLTIEAAEAIIAEHKLASDPASVKTAEQIEIHLTLKDDYPNGGYIRKAPSKSAGEITTLPHGQVVTFMQETAPDEKGNDWYKVQYGELIGWISSTLVEQVK
jgi:hypothetical protein